MECPICNAEMEVKDAYGYLASHQSGEILGYTYKCPNSDGFENKEEAMQFLENSNQTIENIGAVEWEDITCDSSMFSVCGSFYTDKQDILHEGYPC